MEELQSEGFEDENFRREIISRNELKNAEFDLRKLPPSANLAANIFILKAEIIDLPKIRKILVRLRERRSDSGEFGT